jgi:hypothetical protein
MWAGLPVGTGGKNNGKKISVIINDPSRFGL